MTILWILLALVVFIIINRGIVYELEDIIKDQNKEIQDLKNKLRKRRWLNNFTWQCAWYLQTLDIVKNHVKYFMWTLQAKE